MDKNHQLKEEDLEFVRSFFTDFGMLTEKDIRDFISLASKKYLEKSEKFVAQDQVSKEIGFVLSGILRSFHSDKNGNETTFCFSFPNSLVTSYSSYITGNGAMENIQAITSVELLVVSKEKWMELIKRSANWIDFLRQMAEFEYVALEKRVYQFQRDSASERYKDLVSRYPEYLKKIPLHYLASYLGITQRHLSRIRKNFAL
ncbi:Crp/Fnr family transcriptional regulator [Algoriphagus lacus]|uniref:Crp/Fnr family transcriptional regulator n=1 Tax=Algoriphagus lacus TaxID=2056311 RepID=A0A418PNJ4_9BACT|nr:Crp/Fnr family transcriptional regulator [Algoriphagus lacus]RIW13445.1 Crp/Fnr family transcriptional regulator [Algoriphagus lacus]